MISIARCFDIVTLKVLPKSCFWYNLIINLKNPDSEKEGKQNQYEFSNTSFITKHLVDFEKMAVFCRSFCLYISKCLHIHASSSPNISPILLFNGFVMVTNQVSIACKCLKKEIFHI